MPFPLVICGYEHLFFYLRHTFAVVMPLDEDEWDDAESVISNYDYLREFLEDNPSTAYSAEEVAEELLDVDSDFAISIHGSIQESYLDRLVELGEVEERIVRSPDGDRTYYRISDS